MSQYIFILRHGQSVANAERIVAGQLDSSLSELGVQQAEQAAESVSAHRIDLIVSSPMKRARQTAEIIAINSGHRIEDIQIIPELTERNLGDIEGKTYEETGYGTGNFEDAEGVPNIEPIEEFEQRCLEALEAIYELPGKNILVVCHNGAGRMLRTIASGGKSTDMYTQPRLENAVIYPLVEGAAISHEV